MRYRFGRMWQGKKDFANISDPGDDRTVPMVEGGAIMNWEAPSFVEVKMDAEINSYQDDFRDDTETKEPSKDMSLSALVADSNGSM